MSKREAAHYRLEGDLTPDQVEDLRRLEAMLDAGTLKQFRPRRPRPGGTPGACH